MGRAGVGSSYNAPSCRHPQVGKVSEDIGKAQSEVTSDVLQHRPAWSYCAKGVPNVGPQVSVIVLAFPLACGTERLAGVSARDHVNRLNRRPIHGGDIAQVGHAWIVGGEHLAGGWLNLGVPGQVATHGHVKAAVSREQAADPHATRPKKVARWA